MNEKIFLIPKKTMEAIKEDYLYMTGGGEERFRQLNKKISFLAKEEIELLKALNKLYIDSDNLEGYTIIARPEKEIKLAKILLKKLSEVS